MWFFFFKQKTAYGMRISDWSSDVCSSDLQARRALRVHIVLLLPDLMPELLVERRPLSRPRRALAGLSLADRQPRRGDRRAAGQSARPLPDPSTTHDHELPPVLSQGPKSPHAQLGEDLWRERISQNS